MSFSGAIAGFASGVLVQSWAMALARKRYLARPWMHLGMGIAFAYVGYNFNRWEDQMLDLINEKRALKGFPPIKREDINAYNYSNFDKKSITKE